MTDVERIFQDIQRLPVRERLQLVERVVHQLADRPEAEITPTPAPSASSLLGLFASEPDLMDEVCAMAMEARQRDRLRTTSDDDVSLT
jgi:hypothetical protein